MPKQPAAAAFSGKWSKVANGAKAAGLGRLAARDGKLQGLSKAWKAGWEAGLGASRKPKKRVAAKNFRPYLMLGLSVFNLKKKS